MFRRAALVGLVALAACQPVAPNPQLVAQWARASIMAANAERLEPPVASRVTAYASIALYEGFAADQRSKLRSLAGQLNGLWSVPVVEVGHPVDGASVAAEAVRMVLDSLLPSTDPGTLGAINTLAISQLEGRERSRVRDAVRDRSVQHGRALAATILAWASSDGYSATRRRAWRAAGIESKWSNPAGTAPVEPHWGAIRTFALRNGDECAPPPPPTYSLRAGSEFWKMAKELHDSARAASDDQRNAVLFWADSGASSAPAAHWLGALGQVAARRRSTVDQAAEAFMLASVSMADAYVGASREQYRSLVVRPATYVGRVFERRWTGALPTPAFPAYPSSHATVAGAAAAVLSRFFGDSTAFTDSSQVDLSATARAFRSFSHARDEASMSRVHAGVDYLPAVLNGRAQGQCIAQRVMGRLSTRPAP